MSAREAVEIKGFGDLPEPVVKEFVEDGIIVGKKLAMVDFGFGSESLTA
jgi:hypothetical protein